MYYVRLYPRRWYHGNISRREAKIILQDFRGGNGSFLVRSSESFSGKFAISFVWVNHIAKSFQPCPSEKWKECHIVHFHYSRGGCIVCLWFCWGFSWEEQSGGGYCVSVVSTTFDVAPMCTWSFVCQQLHVVGHVCVGQLSSECSGSFLKKIMPVSALALHAVGMKGAVFDSPITRESATIAIYCSFRWNLYLNSLAARSHDCCFEPGKAFDLLNFQPA